MSHYSLQELQAGRNGTQLPKLPFSLMLSLFLQTASRASLRFVPRQHFLLLAIMRLFCRSQLISTDFLWIMEKILLPDESGKAPFAVIGGVE